MSDDQELLSFPATVIPEKDYPAIRSCAQYGYVFNGYEHCDYLEPMWQNVFKYPQYFEDARFYVEDMAREPMKASLNSWQKDAVRDGAGILGGIPGIIAVQDERVSGLIDGLSDNRVCTMIVCNKTNGELIADSPYLPYGVQTGQPLTKISNREAVSIGNIPAPIILYGEKYYGLGIYRFEKNLSWKFGGYGTGGAITFTSEDPHLNGNRFAASWLVPQSGSHGYWVTSNMHGYGKGSKKGTIEAFYEKTADKRKTDGASRFRGDTISAVGKRLQDVHLGGILSSGVFTKENHMLLTVVVESFEEE